MDLDKYKSDLQDLRTRIDGVDQQIVDLLKSRVGIVHQVGELKKSAGVRGSYIYPCREATMLRALIAQFAASDYPPEAVESLWRTLIGVATSVESPLKICAFASVGYAHTLPVAREYFGRHIPASEVFTTSALIEALKADPHLIGIVPPASTQQEGEPWWLSLAGARIPAKVFAIMPFVQRQKLDAEMRCLAIADVPLEPTGKDVSLLVARFEGNASDIAARCNHAILDCGLPVAAITIHENAALLEIDGFLEDGAHSFNTLQFKLTQQSENTLTGLHWIGAYANPWYNPDESTAS